MAQTEHRAHC